MRQHGGKLLEVTAPFISVRSALIACALVGSAWRQIALATEALAPWSNDAVRSGSAEPIPSVFQGYRAYRDLGTQLWIEPNGAAGHAMERQQRHRRLALEPGGSSEKDHAAHGAQTR
jgi:hypothetical protein